MYAAYILFFLGALISGVALLSTDSAPRRGEERAAAAATQLLLFHQAALAYLDDHPSYGGAMSAATLAGYLPTNMAASPQLLSVANGGVVGTYFAIPPLPAPYVAHALGDITWGGWGAGLVAGGVVQSRRGAVLSVPNGVPNDVVAMVTAY